MKYSNFRIYEDIKNQCLYEFIKKHYDINLVQASRNLLADANIIECDLIFGIEKQIQMDV